MLCTRCEKRRRREGQSYCCSCHAAYMRENRKLWPVTAEQRRRSNARAYLNVYIRRGKIYKQPCEVGQTRRNTEGHHEDYSKPLEVRWLCRPHHVMVTNGLLCLLPVKRAAEVPGL